MTHLLTRVLGTAFVLTMFCTLTLIAGDGDSKDGVNEPLPDGPAPYIMSAWYKSDGSIRLCASNAVLKGRTTAKVNQSGTQGRRSLTLTLASKSDCHICHRQSDPYRRIV